MTASPQQLRDWVDDARSRTFSMVDDLRDDQMTVPYLPMVNPFRWEVGHGIWFQEHWVLRHTLGREPLLAGGDQLFDSASVGHEMRWYLEMPKRPELFEYGARVRDAVLEALTASDPTPELRYFTLLSVSHEDMHQEAFCYMRQTLGYPAPSWLGAARPSPGEGSIRGDVRVPGGTATIGASRDEPFVLDNEKWAHEVQVDAFDIARAPVTQGAFRDFVEDGGYQRRDLWSAAGWSWRQSAGASAPVYWRRADGTWQHRVFDGWHDLELELPMMHVCWYEADAWCRWAGRRLPSEAEWEVASAVEVDGGALAGRRREYPWGDGPEPSPERANLDGAGGGPWPVSAVGAGDTPAGCRQMLGNVWEWTDSDFLPYPGFSVDPYKEYSKPWFGCRKALRGGCWMTRTRMLRPTWRNFFTPNRRDVFAGFRSCALHV